MYLHEARTAQALKRLYMLGNTKKHSKESRDAMRNVDESFAAVGNMPGAQAADLKARQQQAALRNLQEQKQLTAARDETEDVSGLSDDDYKQFRDDTYAIRNDGVSRDDVEAIKGPLPGLHDPMKNAQTQLQVNQAARLAPVGGEFTPEGTENHNKQRTSEAQDIGQSKYMMRFGGMLNSLGNPYGPGGNF